MRNWRAAIVYYLFFASKKDVAEHIVRAIFKKYENRGAARCRSIQPLNGQTRAGIRSDDLQNADTAVRFLSVEPLLEDVGKLNLVGISWVIVGGESGPGARAMKKEWVVSVRDQCRRASVPFFFKQWGGVRKSAAGRKPDGRTYDEFPTRVPHPVLTPNECLSLARDIEAAFKRVDLVECLA
jgi:protein gp37